MISLTESIFFSHHTSTETEVHFLVSIHRVQYVPALRKYSYHFSVVTFDDLKMQQHKKK